MKGSIVWYLIFWKNVIFSDESQVVEGDDNRVILIILIPSTKNRKFFCYDIEVYILGGCWNTY
jgi:hypothetical protein